MLKCVVVAAVIVGTVAVSAGVSADTGSCAADGGTVGWLYSSEAGTVELASVTVPDGWRATVTVAVENNVGDVDDPYHDATVTVGSAVFPVERDGQGRMWSGTVTVPSGATPVVLSSSDGWSAAYTVSVAGCEVVPMIETVPELEPMLSPGSTIDEPKPVETSSSPVTSPVERLESLPVTGAGTLLVALVGLSMMLAGVALTMKADKRP